MDVPMGTPWLTTVRPMGHLTNLPMVDAMVKYGIFRGSIHDIHHGSNRGP